MDQTTDTARISVDPGLRPALDPPFAHAVDLDKPLRPSIDEAALPGGGVAHPASPRPAFRLRRSRTDRMLGGVCGGLAANLGVDVTLLRIGLVALTVLGAGFGVVLYLAAWILAPEADA